MHERPRLAYVYAKMALEIPYPKDDILFISDEVYQYQILDEIGATAYYAGKPHVGYHASKRLVEENLVPEEHKERVVENLRSYEKVLQQIHMQEAQQQIHMQMMEEERKRIEKIEKRNTPKKSTKTNKKKKGKSRPKAKR